MASSTNSAAPSGSTGWEPPTVERLQELLPQYEITALIGRGGMGAVYKGTQINLDREIAIKILPENLQGDEDGSFAERFKLEAKAMARLDHPAIISVHDFGQTPEGHLYFVMEFVDGMDLQQYLQPSGGKLEPEAATAIISHVLDALEYAHRHGIVHRDIKPANVLINAEGRVKIADFGLAKQVDGEASGLTQSNVAMGTPDFIAPEALLDNASSDGRADLYAVGVMLYQMLTGKLPRGMFKLPSEDNAGIDPRFDDIIAEALEPNPDQRFSAAKDFRKKLDELRSQPVSRIEGRSTIERRGAKTQDVKPAVPSGLPARPAARKSEGGMMWVVVAIAILGAGGWLLFGPSHDPETKPGNGIVEETPAATTSAPTAGQEPPTATELPEPPTPTATATANSPKSRIDGILLNNLWHDLLPDLASSNSAIRGSWDRQPRGLSCASPQWEAVCALPSEPLADYTLRIRFTCSECNSLRIYFPSPTGGSRLSFRNVNKVVFAGDRESGARRDGRTEPLKFAVDDDHEHLLEIHVASDSVRVLMDDEEIYSRSVASWHELSNVCPVGTPIAFGVGVHDGIAAFTGFEVRAGGANHKPSVTQNNPSQRPPSPSPQNQETPETASKRAYKLNVSDETYIGQPYNDPSHPRPQSDTFFFVESDQSFGKIRWQFRLPPTVDEIRAASLSFHTIDDYRASTTAPFGVWSRNQQVGALPEAEADTWITVPLDFAQIGVSTEFELELRGGNNALVVHGQESGFAPYLTIEATTLTNGLKGSMADVPQLVLRITNYQKTRATQLTELTTKYQGALTSAKKEAEKSGATKSVSVIDLAIQRAKSVPQGH
jgi:hypothetical protein